MVRKLKLLFLCFAACEKRRKEPPSWKEYTGRSKKTLKDVVKKVRKGMSKK